MDRKKLLRYMSVVGASIILGFLSFSGIFALSTFLPLVLILPLAITAFFLSVGYEGQIYYANVKKSLTKLFKPNYLKRHMAKACLRDLLVQMETKAALEKALDTVLRFGATEAEINTDYDAFIALYRESVDSSLQLDVLTLEKFRGYFQEVIDAKKPLNVTNLFSGVSHAQFRPTKQFSTRFAPIEDRFETLKNEKLQSFVSSFTGITPPPSFFTHYAHLLQIHHQYEHGNLHELSRQQERALKKGLHALDDVFMAQLFPDNADKVSLSLGEYTHVVSSAEDMSGVEITKQYVFAKDTGIVYARDKDHQWQPLANQELEAFHQCLSLEEQNAFDEYLYTRELRRYLDTYRPTWEEKLNQRKIGHQFSQWGSAIVGVLMMLGTSYLLVEACAIIPVIAAIPFGLLPALVVPMAVIAGAAFGLLIHNAVTDMLNDEMLQKRWLKIKEDYKNGFTLATGSLAVLTVVLLVLTVALAVCTGGTWWTVVKHTRPLFSVMKYIPDIFIGILAAILGTAMFVFNLGNTLETLEELYLAVKSIKARTVFEFFSSLLQSIGQFIKSGFDAFCKNPVRAINLPRIILKLTYTPLRIVLFLGHLVSIGVTSDRLPGIPEIISALLGITAEFFEDWHYFFSFEHEHKNDIGSLMDEHMESDADDEEAPVGHNHNDDFPTQCLRFLFTPLIRAAAWWDSAFSNGETSFSVALDEQYGRESVSVVKLPIRDTLFVAQAMLSYPDSLPAADKKEALKSVKTRVDEIPKEWNKEKNLSDAQRVERKTRIKTRIYREGKDTHQCESNNDAKPIEKSVPIFEKSTEPKQFIRNLATISREQRGQVAKVGIFAGRHDCASHNNAAPFRPVVPV